MRYLSDGVLVKAVGFIGEFAQLRRDLDFSGPTARQEVGAFAKVLHARQAVLTGALEVVDDRHHRRPQDDGGNQSLLTAQLCNSKFNDSSS